MIVVLEYLYDIGMIFLWPFDESSLKGTGCRSPGIICL